MIFVNSKMARLLFLLFSVLLLQARAAPSDVVDKVEEITKIKTDDIKANEPITLDDVIKSNDDVQVQGQREKRFYNYYGYGFPPMNPVIYPNYPNGNEQYPGNFGEDPLQQIHRRLQDIANVVRAPTFNQPPPPPFPILFPIIYIPQTGCGCSPNQPGKRPSPGKNDTTLDVGISNRFPEMDDSNQNWGLVVNENETEQDDGQPEDFTRPISFDPIRPNKTMNRPPPSVEHGSNQEGREPMGTTTTTVFPPAANSPAANAPAPPPSSVPSQCDAAILTCCHQPQVTYDCFAVQGCPDPTSYGNPCDPQVIFRVIDRYQRFYGQRTG